MKRGLTKRSRTEFEENGDCDAAQGHGHGHHYHAIHLHDNATAHIGDDLSRLPQPPTDHCNEGQESFDRLRDSLLFDRLDARLRIVKKPLLHTCDWLFDHQSYKIWDSGQQLQSHNGFLWIKGKPGCGKSTVMKAALEKAQQCKRRNKNLHILHYFFNARATASLEKSTLGLYRSLVYQLLKSCPSLRSIFWNKFSLKEPIDNNDPWTGQELQDFLLDLVLTCESPTLCIFIDALDEGEAQQDVREMINFLIDLSERSLHASTNCRLRICLSSRHYPYINIRKGLSLTVEDQPEHHRDIEYYVRTKLNGTLGQLKNDISTEICRKSSSIFLWVVLVVDILNQLDDSGSLLENMKAQLDTIPTDLDKLFSDILTRSMHDIEPSIALFQWLLFATRSLQPEELFLAIEYSRFPADLSWLPSCELFIPDSDRLSRYILDCSRGLAEVTPTEPPIVQFIHETVREFLLNKNGLGSVLESLAQNLTGISEDILKTACSRYLTHYSVPDALQGDILRSHARTSDFKHLKRKLRALLPFAEYAISNLLVHADSASYHGIPQHRFLRLQCEDNGDWKMSKVTWYNLLQQYRVRKFLSDITLLYVLAEQGHADLVSALLQTTDTLGVNAQGGRFGSPLQAACVAGKQVTVAALLAAGADPNKQGGEYKHSLVAAVTNNNLTLVPTLIEYGADLPPNLAAAALINVVSRGYTEGVEMMLHMGTSIDSRGARGSNLVHIAVRHHKLAVLQLLISHGANVTHANVRGESPLYLAASSYRSDIAMVRFLIESGAAVNAQGGRYGNALQAACPLYTNDAVVRLLLKEGADVNAQGGHYGNALQAACFHGREDIVRLLLEEGADVNAQGGQYGNALQAACVDGHEDIIRLLLEEGADINAQGGHYGNALQATCFCGYNDIVRLLLEEGVDVTAQGGQYGNALQAACVDGHKGIVRLLLEEGADVNAQGGHYGNALRAAVYRVYADIVDYLIEVGAKVEPGEYVFDEFWASRKGHEISRLENILGPRGATLQKGQL